MTLGDAAGGLRGVAAFAALLMAPGYCFGWASGLLGFRTRGFGEKIAWAIALSFSLMTIVSVLVGKYESLDAVCWIASLCSVAMLALLGLEFLSGRQRMARPERHTALFASIFASAWAVFVVLEMVDVAAGRHLYMSVTVFDHALRTAFVDAVMRSGVPPVNPLYWPGRDAPMRYYYFWYVLAAAAAKLGKTSARDAMIASVAWGGFGFAAVLSLYCRHFLTDHDPPGRAPGQAGEPGEPGEPHSGRGQRIGRSEVGRFGVAMGLCFVTGLDLLPAIVKFLLRQPVDGDMEWWSSDQVTSWMGTLLWVPHHAAGLVCCLFGFLLVWMSGNEVWMSGNRGRRTQGMCALVAGAAFASALGLSTWVAIAFGLVLPAWALWSLVRRQGSRGRLAVLVASGLLAGAFAAPYLLELRGGQSGVTPLPHHGVLPGAPSSPPTVNQPTPLTAPTPPKSPTSGGALHLLRFGVRRIIDPDALLGMPAVARFARAYPRTEDTLAGLLLLLPGYFVELGLFGVVFVVAVRQMVRRRTSGSRRSRREHEGTRTEAINPEATRAEATQAAIVLASLGLLVTTFLRSQIVVNNDFGFRSALLPQFFLLLLAVRWSEGAFATGKALVNTWKVMLWIGVAGTIYQVVLLRLYLPLEEDVPASSIAGLSERALAMRVAFHAMDARIPIRARVQYNTAQPDDYFRIAQTLYVDRQVVNAYPGCATPFGGDPAACPAIEAGMAQLFRQAGADQDGSVVSEQPGGVSAEPGVMSAPGGVSADQGGILAERGGVSAERARALCDRTGTNYLIATRWDRVWQDARGWVWVLPVVVDAGEVRVLACGPNAEAARP